MRIAEIATYVLRVPLGEERFFSSQTAFPARNSMLVRITTDDGVVGWGEGGQYGPAEPVASCIQEVLAPVLLQEQVLHPGVVWERLYAKVRDFGSKGPYIEAISALDIALWDVRGRLLGQPVHALLGGAFRLQVPAYATGCYYRGGEYLDPSAQLPLLREEAAGYVADGFAALKVKIGLLNLRQDLERVAEVRRVVGDEAILLVDCNHAYNVFTAVKMGRELGQFDVTWFEEPVPPEDLEGYRRVRDQVPMAVAGGECEYTRYGFLGLLRGGCVDIAQPDLCVCGGISEWQKIQALASAFGVWTIPHVWGSGVALAAALHAAAAIPSFPHTANPIALQNEPMIEYDRNPNPLRDELLVEPICFAHGRLAVPVGPGLGVRVDERQLQRYGTGFGSRRAG